MIHGIGVLSVALAILALPAVVVEQVVSLDRGARLRAERVDLPTVAAAHQVRVGDLVRDDVVVAAPAPSPPPAPADRHRGVAGVLNVAVLQRRVLHVPKEDRRRPGVLDWHVRDSVVADGEILVPLAFICLVASVEATCVHH